MPRRNRIILEQRERIIQAFENTNKDYLMVADTIGVNRSTARSTRNRDEARNRGLALGHYRTQLLLEALNRNIGTITPAKSGQWFRFMQTYLPRCINREFIEG